MFACSLRPVASTGTRAGDARFSLYGACLGADSFCSRAARVSMEGWVRSQTLKALIFACAVALVSAHTAGAQAQAAEKGDEIKGNVAGTVGLGLLGAEVGLILVPACKLQDHWWAWVLFPTVFAAGGAVAGALAFDPGSPGPAVTVSLLGAGIALAIPAIVGAVALKDKRQARDQAQDSGGVLRFGSKQRWGVPAIATRPAYTAAERLRYGAPQRTIVQVPLVSGRF